MTLSAALSNALSGLTAASRNAQVTASNISNAMTEGYGRRELEVVSRDIGGMGGVTRTCIFCRIWSNHFKFSKR